MLKKAYYTTLAHINQTFENHRALPELNPILVYSMRKVGSTTLTDTLRTAGYTAYKQHCINPALNQELCMASSRAGIETQHWLSDGTRFRKRLDKWRTKHQSRNQENRLKVFTFVKDPLAIALSDFFMQLFEFMPKVVAIKGLNDIDALQNYFKVVLHAAVEGGSPDPLVDYLGKLGAMPAYWFERELKATMGVDVFDTPFSADAGYSVYHGHDSDVILIRTDKLSHVALDAIEIMTGNKPARFNEKNVRATTAEGKLYVSLVNSLNLPTSLLRQYYSQPWLNHFFSDIEIKSMINKWGHKI